MEAMLLYLGRWCLWVGGACRAGKPGWGVPPSRPGAGYGGARQERLGQRVPRGQASSEAGAGQGGFLHWGTPPRASVSTVGTAHAHSTPPPASHVGETKHGMMKFREDRSLLGLGLPTGGFHDRYFILNSSCLRLYKEVRVCDPAGSCPGSGHLHPRVLSHPGSSVPLGLMAGASPSWGLDMAQHWLRGAVDSQRPSRCGSGFALGPSQAPVSECRYIRHVLSPRAWSCHPQEDAVW